MFFLMLTGRLLLVRYTGVLLLLLTAGCVGVAPIHEAAQPPGVTAQAAAPHSAVVPVAPTVAARAPKPAATPVVPEPTAPVVAPRMLDLNALEAQLRATMAIGLFTKISLENQIDELMKQFRDHYEGKTTGTMTELRWSYDLLIMKVLSLLQDTDQMLASAIVSSREAIWVLLSDQNTFANL